MFIRVVLNDKLLKNFKAEPSNLQDDLCQRLLGKICWLVGLDKRADK